MLMTGPQKPCTQQLGVRVEFRIGAKMWLLILSNTSVVIIFIIKCEQLTYKYYRSTCRDFGCRGQVYIDGV